MAKNVFEAEEVFFTSDCHFGHKNVIEYCSRPFQDIYEMNAKLIENWNNVVSHTSHVFITGDFCFRNKEEWEMHLLCLKGKKHLILGNHDYQKNIPYDLFESVNQTLMITVTGDSECPKQQVFMCHYPMITWDAAHRGSWQAFGHIHTMKGHRTKWDNVMTPNQYDVGVDNNDYTPISFEQLKKEITKRNLR